MYFHFTLLCRATCLPAYGMHNHCAYNWSGYLGEVDCFHVSYYASLFPWLHTLHNLSSYVSLFPWLHAPTYPLASISLFPWLHTLITCPLMFHCFHGYMLQLIPLRFLVSLVTYFRSFLFLVSLVTYFRSSSSFFPWLHTFARPLAFPRWPCCCWSRGMEARCGRHDRGFCELHLMIAIHVGLCGLPDL